MAFRQMKSLLKCFFNYIILLSDKKCLIVRMEMILMDNNFDFLIYNIPDDEVSVNAVIKDETVWLTQKAMAELFDCSTDNIGLHLKIFLMMVNWIKIQLPRNPWQLLQMGKNM